MTQVLRRDPADPSAWVRAARGQDWAGVEAALADVEMASAAASLRYLCARAAVEQGHRQRALNCLSGLDSNLPGLDSNVDRLRKRAETMPPDAPEAQAPRSVAPNSPPSKATPSSPSHRAGTRQGGVAVASLTAQANPKSAVGDASAAEGAKLAPKVLVEATASASEHLRLARRHAKNGRVEEFELELARARAAENSASVIEDAEVVHLRGLAFYSSRDYAKSLSWLERSARSGSKHALDDQFRHARALARADDNLGAIVAFERFLVDHPKSRLAARARYLIARLNFIMGRWGDAVATYDQMRRKKDRGRHVADYPYERAVSLLLMGRAADAVLAFEELLAKPPRAREIPRLTQLRAVALHRAGRESEAIEIWQGLVRERPLSLAAEFARLRLAKYGADVPKAVSNGDRGLATAPSRVPSLPVGVDTLLELGLDDEAELRLSRTESSWLSGVERDSQAADGVRCRVYAKTSVAHRRHRSGRRILRARGNGWGSAEQLQPDWLARCAHPQAHAEIVAAAERGWALPPHLIHSVMMAESGFNPTVVSKAKAVGLMQLIPPTARKVAAQIGVEYDARLLERPAFSIGFGAHYLSILAKMWNDNLPLILASYNAGPKVTSRWMESGDDLPTDLFVARIPYRETRGYVYRVMSNWIAYRTIYSHAGSEETLRGFEFNMPKGLRAPGDAF